MGTLRDPSTINNVGTLGGATNPTTAQALPLERENQKAIRELVGAFGYEDLTISAGGITPTKAEVTVDTEAGASADDLTTIYLVSDGTTTLHDGMILKLRAYDPARAVTVKHGSGVNQIQTVSGTDIVLGTTWELTLKLQSGVWKEVQGKPVIDITGNAATATDLASGSVLSVAKGGTGGTTEAGARSSLGLGSASVKEAVATSSGAADEGKVPALGAGGRLATGFVDFAAGMNASGNAPLYAARAFVNFNGTGSVPIRASGNVSSITDNGVGDYTVNFNAAMQDANYAVVFGTGSASAGYGNTQNIVSMATSGLRFVNTLQSGGVLLLSDLQFETVAIFR